MDGRRQAPALHALRPARRRGLGAVPAEGLGGHHRHLERPAVHPLRPAGLCAGGRQPGHPEALRDRAAHRRAGGRGGGRAVRPAGGGCAHRRARDGGGLQCPALRPPGVHRQHRGRQGHHAQCRGQPGAAHPGAGRQVAHPHRAQRRPGHRGLPPRRRQGRQRRPAVRQSGRGLCGRRAARGLRRGPQRSLRRPLSHAGRQHRPHRGGERQAPGPHRSLPGRRRRARCPGRVHPGRGAGRPALPAAHRHRPARRCAHPAGGDLRPGRGGQELRRHRRGHCRHQQPPASPGPVLLRRGCRRAAAGARPHPVRRGHPQRGDVPRGDARRALRRRGRLRHGPLPRARRLHRVQPRAHRVQGSRLRPAPRVGHAPALRRALPGGDGSAGHAMGAAARPPEGALPPLGRMSRSDRRVVQ